MWTLLSRKEPDLTRDRALRGCFRGGFVCVASFQSEGKPPCFNTFRNLNRSFNNKETDVSCPNNTKLNELQRNEQPNECKAKERLNTAQLNKRMVESADTLAAQTTKGSLSNNNAKDNVN